MSSRHSSKGVVRVRIIDISPAIDASAAIWPGDVPYSLQPNWSIDQGDSVTVNTVTSTAHVGAHIDAPSHIVGGAPSIFETPLDACIGPALVVDVSEFVDGSSSPRGVAPAVAVRARIVELIGNDRVERLLLRHEAPAANASADWDADIPGVDPDLMEWFGSQGGRLMGIDLASYDYTSSKELLAHKAGIAHSVVLLEGLDLSEAPEGPAEIIALPLPWRGADASPVRAVLRIDD